MAETLALVFRGEELLVLDSETPRIPLIGESWPSDLAGSEPHYSGRLGGVSYAAYLVEDETSEPPEGLKFVHLRSLLADLRAPYASIAARAGQILGWRRNHTYCGRCGSQMADDAEETARRCGTCGHVVYPRISPAIIVGVLRDNRLLLARNRRYRTPRYSIIAGFVEPGERLEDTVAREIDEEVSIRVSNIRYFGSQPWPFPDSLMIGFLADHESGEISVDGKEIVDAGWFAPDDMPPVPPHGSISRRIIDWYCEQYRTGSG